MTIVEERLAITGGVDTHSEVHVAAALDPVGGLLGTREFPASAAGYASLLGWLGKFGDVALIGVEGTGSYGAGLARYLAAADVHVVEVDRADRQDRHRRGKSDPLDAVSAARAALSGRAAGAPKGRDGQVEASCPQSSLKTLPGSKPGNVSAKRLSDPLTRHRSIDLAGWRSSSTSLSVISAALG